MNTGISVTISVVYKGQTVHINEKSQIGLIDTLTDIPPRGSRPYLSPAYSGQAGIVGPSHFSGKKQKFGLLHQILFLDPGLMQKLKSL